ncbi:MAG TPA: lysine exporter LysO family protein [Firmicutes bacterium]|nr:lysine exporter LysO family protein [Bacillota bacterium]
MIFFFSCLIFLSLGFFVGRFFKIPINATKQISWVILLLMLFCLGFTVGSNRNVLQNIRSLGLQAIIICFATVAGSLLAVKLYLLKGENHDR